MNKQKNNGMNIREVIMIFAVLATLSISLMTSFASL